jgi:drug/metabolite transporter (DMT)-like permease
VTALILNVVLSVLFFHVIRAAQVRGSNMMIVGAVNYVLASAASFMLSWLDGNLALSSPTLFWGAVQGIAFVVTYFLICASMSVSGMAISTAFMRLSVVIPVVASIVVWGEVPNGFQVLGILACVGSLPLIGMRTIGGARSARASWRDVGVLAMLFLGVGIAGVASKAFVEADVPDARTTYMGVLYGVAALGALATFLSPRWRRNRSGVWGGVKMGFFNVTSIVAYLIALEQVPGVVAFPVQASGGLLLNTAFAAIVWRERFAGHTLAGMGLGAVGLVLVNLN